MEKEDFKLSNLPSEYQLDQQGTYDQINQLFNEQDKQEKKIQEARDILGESAKDLTDEQVFDLINEIQFLIDSWIEEYEEKVFEGKKLKDLLQIDV